jgi:hypothetical protein
VGQILGDLLILALYGLPLSIAEGWAFADPRKTEKEPRRELPESPQAVESSATPDRPIGLEAPSPGQDSTASYGRLADWWPKLQSVPARLVAGGFLTAAVVVVGAGAFALYYLFSDQPEKVSLILPRFAYWLPFGLLGLVTDIPFQVFGWEDRRVRVLLRLILWWFPRLVIFAFVFSPPVLQDLDPAITALAVLTIEGVLAVFFLWLHASRDRMPCMLT